MNFGGAPCHFNSQISGRGIKYPLLLNDFQMSIVHIMQECCLKIADGMQGVSQTRIHTDDTSILNISNICIYELRSHIPSSGGVLITIPCHTWGSTRTILTLE